MRTILNLLLASCTAMAATACALLQPIHADDEARYSAKLVLTTYAATQQAIILYGRLPTCDLTQSRLCKDKHVWVKLKATEAIATTAIAAAEPILNAQAIDTGQIIAALHAMQTVTETMRRAQETLKESRP